MAYTDLEMKNFTQVAYADFGDAYDYLRTVYPDRESFSIAELTAAAKTTNPGGDYSCLDCLTADQMQNWSISLVQDHNDQSGFYACVIETAPGQAAIAFRGSESMSDPSNLYNDWLRADLGLLNSTETNQHAEVRQFLAEHADMLSKYDSIAVTGHSLGGNLAEYATIVSGEYGLSDRIDQCISFDGPGFSNEFIARYRDEISDMSGVMTHYQWSFVGGLLFNLPGVARVTCSVSNDANSEDDAQYNMFTRHDTKYLEFDENGNIKPGSRDTFSMFIDGFSKSLESMISFSPLSFVLLPYILFTNGFADLGEIFNSFIEGVKTTYQKIHRFFEKWFNRNNGSFKVNTCSLSSDAGKIEAGIRRVREMVAEMFGSVQALNAMWKGPANAAFASKFAAEQEEINRYLDSITVYVTSITDDSRAYNCCENKALSVISSLRF